MKYAAVIGIAILIAGALWWRALKEEETAVPAAQITPSSTVRMTEEGYSTTTVAIGAGEAILFVNESARDRWPASDLHPTHEIYSQFDPKQPISPGESWQFRFERCGRWRFHDHLQPSIRGVIVVACGPQVQ